MNKTGPPKTPLTIAAQRRFFQWAIKWFYTTAPPEKKCKNEVCDVPGSTSPNNTNKIPKAEEPHVESFAKPNLPNLMMLLQAAGFQLREFELSKEANTVSKDSIKVTIECGSSQMKAVLEMGEIECQCPSNTEATEGSFWSICGTGRTKNDSASSSKYEESGTNLLPVIPSGVNNVVRDVVQRLFKIMNTPRELQRSSSIESINLESLGNHTPDFKKAAMMDHFFRSHTQPAIPTVSYRLGLKDIVPARVLFPSPEKNDSNTTNLPLNEVKIRDVVMQRQKTWLLSMNSDSGTILPNLVNPTSEKSDQRRNSQGTNMDANDYVMQAYKNLDQAVELLQLNRPSETSSPVSDNDTLDNRPVSSFSSSGFSSGPRQETTSFCSSMAPRTLKTSPAKLVPMKALPRRSLPNAVYNKSTGSSSDTSPIRRKNPIGNLPILPQKTTPIHKMPVSRTSSNSSSYLSDRSFNSARRNSYQRSSTLTPTKNTFGPSNTSFRGPTRMPNPKTTTLNSKGNPDLKMKFELGKLK